MEYGEKIANLRKKKGMTQAELGAELNVTYQAVSKWERGESHPDFDTMSRIGKLFDVPISYFEEDGEEQEEEESDESESEEEYEEESADFLGVCTVCGKALYEGDEAVRDPALVCACCHERQIKEKEAAQRAAAVRRAAEARAKQEKEERAQRDALEAQLRRKQAACARRNRGLIVGGIVAAIGLICVIVSSVSAKSAADFGYGLLGCVILFTFVSQMVWGGVVRKVCTYGGAVIGTPGVIFTLDLDGVFFLIGVKILFAVLRMLILLITTLALVFVSILIAPFTFIPACIQICR